MDSAIEMEHLGWGGEDGKTPTVTARQQIALGAGDVADLLDLIEEGNFEPMALPVGTKRRYCAGDLRFLRVDGRWVATF